ncbi:MAG: 30S ribosomal protein S4 [Deltaproteobacteria bacterium CG11_big_fil_rev_8_21_14_0_20_47_16]|nr:MAG: 30S ribosomal protein S4 [Deltaproteobacteria bacterium CG11_big_fil_rev_8_21_14_0_20_47_16]
MARYCDSVCRLCRREGIKLFLKGDRCFSDKCAIERRQYAPGQHGQARKKQSEYGTQLREKQKVKRIYGILERQFRRYFSMAERMKGITGDNLILLLERRLDNLVCRMGFGRSREEARQLVRQGHFTVNGKRVNIPSYLVQQGDVVAVAEKSRKIARINEALAGAERRGLPEWVSLNKDDYSAQLMAYPAGEQLVMGHIKPQLIVELYSK